MLTNKWLQAILLLALSYLEQKRRECLIMRDGIDTSLRWTVGYVYLDCVNVSFYKPFYSLVDYSSQMLMMQGTPYRLYHCIFIMGLSKI